MPARDAGLDRRLRALPLRLGFGTAWLPRDDSAARSLLELAIGSGIRYFDTARMYGSGRAEWQLGAVLRDLPNDVREAIVLATKLGIVPQSDALPVRVMRKLAEALTWTPHPAALPRFGQFTPKAMTASFETSLSALGGDRVDILLLHEVAPEHLTDEALRLLEDLSQSGTVGRLGLATDISQTVAILRTVGPGFEAVQIADDAWKGDAGRLLTPGRLLLTHSQLIDRFRQLAAQLASDAERRLTWSRALDFDAGEPGALAGMFLRYALTQNPDGIVLFSTTSPEHLRANVRHAMMGALDEARTRQLQELITR